MRYQRAAGLCGPAAISNALRCFGHRVNQRTIAKLASASVHEGTDEFGIIEAINALGYVATEYKGKNRADAYIWLNYALGNGPVILCVDNFGHWLTAIGKSADRIIIVDPSNTVRNKDENGIHVYGRAEIMRRWFNRQENSVYAIGIAKR